MADPHQPTAKYPQLDERRVRLIKKFEEGSLTGLGFEIYKMAREEVDAVEKKLPHARKNYKACYRKLVADYDGEREMMILLCSMHKDVVKALLWNDIGYKIETVPGFSELFYAMDAASGTYMNTLVIESEVDTDIGKGLNRRQWRALSDMMKRYVDGHGLRINAQSSTEDKEASEQAAQIDNAYRDKEINHKQGERFFMVGDAMPIRIFLKKLQERIRKDLDRDGKIQQMQFPIEIGCATTFLSRMYVHLPDTTRGLDSTTKVWGLVLSCLKVLKINFECKFKPIIKIWKREQYELAEILGTILAGSLVDDGGFNPKQPGTNPCKHPEGHGFDRGNSEVFFTKDWIWTNIKAETENGNARLRAIDEKKETIKAIEDQTVNIKERLDLLVEKHDDCKTELKTMYQLLGTKQKDHDETLKNNERFLIDAEKVRDDNELLAGFADNIKPWLDAYDDSDSDPDSDEELKKIVLRATNGETNTLDFPDEADQDSDPISTKDMSEIMRRARDGESLTFDLPSQDANSDTTDEDVREVLLRARTGKPPIFEDSADEDQDYSSDATDEGVREVLRRARAGESHVFDDSTDVDEDEDGDGDGDGDTRSDATDGDVRNVLRKARVDKGLAFDDSAAKDKDVREVLQEATPRESHNSNIPHATPTEAPSSYWSNPYQPEGVLVEVTRVKKSRHSG